MILSTLIALSATFTTKTDPNLVACYRILEVSLMEGSPFVPNQQMTEAQLREQTEKWMYICSEIIKTKDQENGKSH